mgnify:CR=1 FL=1|jgi:hypothetical protein|tara:strand:- start:15 stop:299 length:285 start_codon:yes stop_codon:yes gene_type:complete
MGTQQRKEDKTLLWLFKNKDKSKDIQPDFTGMGRIKKEVLKELVETYKNHADGETLKLRCAGWEKTGDNGPYIFITIEPEKPMPAKEDESDIPF